MATVLGSPVIETDVDLGTLLASFPGGDPVPTSMLPAHVNRPIAVRHSPSVYGNGLVDNRAAFSIDVPAGLTSYDLPTGYPGGAGDTAGRLAEWLRPYPGLARLGQPSEVTVTEYRLAPDGTAVITRVFASWEDSSEVDLAQANAWAAEHLDILTTPTADAPWVTGLLKPAIAGNDAAQHEVISWWLTLYAFSMLARYQPREWTVLLDVDESPLALPIERILQHAREAVPALLHQVLESIKAYDSGS